MIGYAMDSHENNFSSQQHALQPADYSNACNANKIVLRQVVERRRPVGVALSPAARKLLQVTAQSWEL